jgi:hypothetical protein
VALCLNVLDFRTGRTDADGFPACQPRAVRHVRLAGPAGRRRDPARQAVRQALTAAVRGLPDLPTRLLNACTPTTPVEVALRAGGASGHVTLRARLDDPRGHRTARVRLECRGS